MISIKIQELSSGFVIEYFDTEQDSDLDENNIWLKDWDTVVEYLTNKKEKTLYLRKHP